ncbi:MAG: hypothetical protein E7584_03560 [Ruminococcaceae bacterium]|nr:hypothetical protein [Oscillospiraceae bacterium]
MKNSEKKVKIKVKPKRITRAERKEAKLAQKSREALQLCAAAGEFHNAYLAIQLRCEEAKFEELKARLAALQLEGETTVTVKKQRRIAPKKEVIEF